MIKLNEIIDKRQPNDMAECLLWLFQANIKRSDIIDLTGYSDKIPHSMKNALRTYKRGLTTHPESKRTPLLDHELIFKPFSLTKKTVVLDTNVHQHWKQKFVDCQHIMIHEVNEKHKILETFHRVCHQLKNNPQHVYVIGGGIVCDIGAFCCAFLNIPFTLVPTTLLAMIDASIGGKCGVNFEPYGKNQVGLFASTSRVWIDTDFLSTLPTREFRSGLAEAYKHYFLNPQGVSPKEIPKDATGCNKQNINSLIQIKKSIIQKDPYEKGLRKTLNFGHTFGHALESLTSFSDHPFLHGETVAWGMLFAQFVCVQINQKTTKSLEKLTLELNSFKLLNNVDIILNQWDLNKLVFYIEQDKKNNTHIQMVLYTSPGKLLNHAHTNPITTKDISRYLAQFHQYLKDNKQRFS